MADSSWNKVGALVKLVGAIAAAGILVGAMLFPSIGGAGLAARNAAEMVDDIPISFTEQPPSTVSSVYAADGSAMTTYYSEYRLPVPLARIPVQMQQAIVSIEDERFYKHNGIDTKGTLRALFQNVSSGGVSQGGSTLTQQLVKNTLLYQATTQKERQAAIEPSIGRKLREAKIALEIEKKYTKQQILEKYLNLMNFGAGAYGYAAAAQVYFNLPPENLSLDQVALLAGVVQNPTRNSPFNDPAAAKARRDLVINQMARLKYVTTAQATEAKKKPLPATPFPAPGRACALVGNNGGFFCDYLYQYLTKTLGIPESVLKSDGLQIKTTWNPAMQAAVNAGIIEPGTNDDSGNFTLSDNKLAMMDVMEPGTGKVFALGLNKNYGNDPNDPTQTSVNYPILPGEGAGSTYKLFPTVVALTNGDGINFTQTTGNSYTSKVFKNGNKPYTVGNAGVYEATLPLWKALYQSANTYFVALEDHIGNMNPIADTATAMGLWAPGDTAIADKVKAEQQASFTLGPGSANPLRLGTAYNTVAGRGTKCEPVPVTDVLAANGQPLVDPKTNKPYFTPGSNCTANVVAPGVADSINQILKKDVEPGNPAQTGGRAYVSGYDIAGKTGTAQGNASYSFIGYTPKILASVLAYEPKDPANPPLPGLGGAQGFGGGYPAAMWRAAMVNILPLVGPADFPPSDPAVDKGKTFTLSVNCVGKSPQACAAALEGAGVSPVQSADQVASAVPAGAVATQSPPAGSEVSPGQAVYFNLSNGQPAAAAPLPPCQPGQPVDPAACTPTEVPGGNGGGNNNGGGSGNGNGNGNGNGGGNGGGGNGG